jgi:osmoprotectant transport system ATP-binding protein
MTGAMTALIQLVGVEKHFGDAAALHQIDLSVDRGKTTVLIGPSGCGKSTLLRLIIGLVRPDAGEIIFHGKPVSADALQSFRRRVGYVIQEGGLFPHLTARDNILLMARHLSRHNELDVGKLRGPKPASSSVGRNGFDARVAELCRLTAFSETLLDRYPLELSGGQRQRVSLMRALMLSPELLLLDEPLGALDPLVRSSLQKDLKQIFQNLNQTALLVTHDLAEAAYLGDRIVLMSEGRIIQQGSIADFQQRPANKFVSDFINAQRSTTLL